MYDCLCRFYCIFSISCTCNGDFHHLRSAFAITRDHFCKRDTYKVQCVLKLAYFNCCRAFAGRNEKDAVVRARISVDNDHVKTYVGGLLQAFLQNVSAELRVCVNEGKHSAVSCTHLRAHETVL